MKRAVCTFVLLLTTAMALMPQGLCVAALLAACRGGSCCNGSDCAVDAGNDSLAAVPCEGDGCNCLLHPKACCQREATSLQHGKALKLADAAAPFVIVAFTVEPLQRCLAAPSTADSPPPSGGPPLYIRHASILI